MNIKLICSILFTIILAFLILIGTKTALGIIVAIILFLFYIGLIFKVGIEKINKYALYFIIATIPFPYLFQFFGKDALTITTLMIYLLFTVIVFDHLFRQKRISLEPTFALMLPILMFASLTLSLILNPYFIGQSIRYYVANISGIILYFLIIKCVNDIGQLTKVLVALVLTVAVQTCVTALQLYAPDLAAFICAPFATRVDVPQAVLAEGFLRATGTVGDYELLANWFLISALWSIGLVYIRKDMMFISLVIVLFLGILATGTRSAFILFPVGYVAVTLLFTWLVPSRRKVALKIFCLGLVLCTLAILFRQHMGGIWIRLQDYLNSRNLLNPEAMNRLEVWDIAMSEFLTKVTFWGHGFHNVELQYSWAGSFHSLYFTILYKQGLSGMILHIAFWFFLLIQSIKALKLSKRDGERGLVIVSITAVFFLLIDGIKVEYLRYAHTIQFAWMIYAFNVVACKTARKLSALRNLNETPNASLILGSTMPTRMKGSFLGDGQ